MSPALCRYWILIAIAIFALAVAAPSFRKPSEADWLTTYVPAAREMVAHRHMHELGRPFTYPPAAALIALPVAGMSSMFALVGWYIASLAATCVVVACAWRLAGGSAFAQITREWLWIFAVAALIGLRLFISPFGNRQSDMMVAAGVLGGCWLLSKGRDLSGALAIGAAAAVKCTPLLFAPYLAFRGRWRAASVVVLVAVVLNYLPDVVWPQQSGQSYMKQWVEICLTPVRSGTPGQWFADPLRNQSIAGLIGRFGTFGVITNPKQVDTVPPPGSPQRVRALKLTTYGISLLLLAITAWRFGFRKPDQFQSAVEFSAVICLMLLLSPMTSKAHLCVLILPLFLIARVIVERRTAGWIAFGIALVVFGPLAASDLLGGYLSDMASAWGMPVVFVFLNLAAMWKLAGFDHEAGASRAAR